MKKIFAIILSLLMVLPLCMSVSAAGDAISFDSAWKITSSSEFFPVAKAFDGDRATYWHSNYKAEGGTILSHDEAPYVITVKFGKDTEVSGWRYTPRSDNETGTVLKYNIYASKDGESFNKIFTGTFDYANKTKAEFTPSVASWGAYTMKAVKIEITDGRGGYGTAAEIEFLKGTSGTAIENGEAFRESGNAPSAGTAESVTGSSHPVAGKLLVNDGTWKFTTSSDLGNTVGKAFDGDKKTHWHSNYKAEGSTILSHDECPHTVTVDFGKTVEITGWRYTQRHDNGTGTVLTYNLYASDDGSNFTKIYSGSFDYKAGAIEEQTAYNAFFEKTAMKVMKIEVTSSLSGYGSAAEIEFYEDASGPSASGNTSVSAPEELEYSGTKIPFDSAWKITSSSEFSPVAGAFDGDKATYWHSKYTAEGSTITRRDELPFTVRVEFPEAIDVSGWIYTPRIDNAVGTVASYNIKGSSDGVNFEKIYVGNFTNYTTVAKNNKPESASWGNKKVKVIEIEITAANSNFGSAAEIEFLKDGKADNAEAYEGESRTGVPYLARGTWDIMVNSTRGGQSIQLAIDGDEKTYWHSNYEAKDGAVVGHDNPPYYIDIDFGLPKIISGVNLTPRQDSVNGNFIIVNLYASETSDGEWVLLKEKVPFEQSMGDKEMFFLSNIKASKIRIEATSTVAGYGTMAEINVLGENPGLETVDYEEFKKIENAGILYPIDKKLFKMSYEGESWGTSTPDKALDGTVKTFWQTEELKTGEEAIFTVDMQRVHRVKEITYTPRDTNDFHGCWLEVSVWVSEDNENWVPVTENMIMEKDLSTKKITFPEEMKVRYIEFTVHEYFAKRVSVAELDFYQYAGEDESGEKYVLTVGSNEIKYNVTGEDEVKTIDVAPNIVNGTTLIPLRGLLELMGAEISWNGDNQVIGVTGSEIDITLQIGYKLVFVEDPTYGTLRYTLRTVPVIKDSRTFIPVRFVSEQLGYNVAWNGETGEITITK